MQPKVNRTVDSNVMQGGLVRHRAVSTLTARRAEDGQHADLPT
jgi:hypothetical protein